MHLLQSLGVVSQANENNKIIVDKTLKTKKATPVLAWKYVLRSKQFIVDNKVEFLSCEALEAFSLAAASDGAKSRLADRLGVSRSSLTIPSGMRNAW